MIDNSTVPGYRRRRVYVACRCYSAEQALLAVLEHAAEISDLRAIEHAISLVRSVAARNGGGGK
jgi:hypothetical protein